MRVTSRHLLGLPTRELLEREERRSTLHVPGGPGVTKVVPAEVSYTRSRERFVPSRCADLSDGFPFVREHAHRMPADLRAYDLYRRVVERHSDRAPCFRLVRMNPRELA